MCGGVCVWVSVGDECVGIGKCVWVSVCVGEYVGGKCVGDYVGEGEYMWMCVVSMSGWGLWKMQRED